MSSNTLKGIGQEGDGDDEGGSAGQRRDDDAAGPSPATHGAPHAEVLPEHMRGPLKNFRSPESTVPGTPSLDAAVPDAAPSLDGKVPALSATLMGMAAPSVNKQEAGREGREKGTVQGRDVHLPAEVQRVAGVRAVASFPTVELTATPEPIDHSEPTIADPILRSGGVVATPGSGITGDSQGPWYDQDASGDGDVYEDDPAPSVLGRAAIGVALAAGLSILVFALLRVGVSAPATEQAVVPPPPSAPATPSAPLPAPAPPEPVDNAPPVNRSEEQAGAAALPSEREGSSNPASNDSGAASGDPGDSSPSPRVASRNAQASPKPSTRSAATTPSPAVPRPQATTTEIAPPPLSSPAIAPAPVPPVSRPPVEVAPPPFPSSPKPAAVDRPRGKGTYDPDSTLPLNFD